MNAAKSKAFVQLDGPLTVPHADAIHARLVAAFEASGPVVIDISGATAIDVSFLQLLVASQKTSVALKQPLSLVGDGSALLMEEAARCGLSPVSAINGAPVLPPFQEGPAV